MMTEKWRFPAANHGKRKGISSGDTEAFKKAPYSAFAREILQNSIDASDSDEEPVRVEFKRFEICTNDIPGIEELRAAVKRCIKFWEYKKDYVQEYEKIENELGKLTLTCLRVSDFNTTGLIGVESNENEKNQFLALTRGTGVSEKNGDTAGGSKGMGKNAAFLMSKIRTVFYSTKTTKSLDGRTFGHDGSIGVADLISGYLNDDIDINKDYTQGEGYYSVDEYNSALPSLLNLEKNYTIRNQNPGTDIYILGFRDDEDWDKEIINSTLDSFMASIVRNKLEIIINNTCINKDTVEDIVYSDIILKNNKSNIISQYRLLTDGENVKTFDINTDFGNAELYILPLSKEEEELATHKCVMVRHPLMKIKDEPLGASYRASAMCIIPDNQLGKMLRKIENPQHIDWEPKRIQDDPALKKEYISLLKDIKNQINEKIIECLSLGDCDPLDPYGAGDFLPDEDFGESKSESKGNETIIDKTTVSPEKEVKPSNKNANQEDDNGQGLQPDIGDTNEDNDGDVEYPNGHNDGDGEDPHGGDSSGEKNPGDNVIMVRSKLSGVKYKIISLNKENGEIRVIFNSPLNIKECYLDLGILDDNNNVEKVEIINMKKNGTLINSNNKYEYGPFEIQQNEKVVLDVTTNIKGYFAASVKVVCIERKDK